MNFSTTAIFLGLKLYRQRRYLARRVSFTITKFRVFHFAYQVHRPIARYYFQVSRTFFQMKTPFKQSKTANSTDNTEKYFNFLWKQYLTPEPRELRKFEPFFLLWLSASRFCASSASDQPTVFVSRFLVELQTQDLNKQKPSFSCMLYIMSISHRRESLGEELVTVNSIRAPAGHLKKFPKKYCWGTTTR